MGGVVRVVIEARYRENVTIGCTTTDISVLEAMKEKLSMNLDVFLELLEGFANLQHALMRVRVRISGLE